MSTTKDISSTGRARDEAQAVDHRAQPGSAGAPSGGIGGSRSAAYSAGGEQHRVDAVGVGEAVLEPGTQHAGDQRAEHLPDIADGEVQGVRRRRPAPAARCAG